jgi:membrane-associated protease RseP (regulator of RpoE activity)
MAKNFKNATSPISADFPAYWAILIQLVTLTPASVIENEKIVGKIGVGVQIPEGFRESLMIEYSLPPVEALKAAFERTWYYSGVTLKMIGYMFVGKVSVENLSGPISLNIVYPCHPVSKFDTIRTKNQVPYLQSRLSSNAILNYPAYHRWHDRLPCF